jgi:aspartyl-tRNA(Asn)/glutamyl-tRNA(Gln) amidotransferase subunit A
LQNRRFGALQGLVLKDVRDAPLAAYQSALERLSAAGAEIVPVEFPEIEGPMADAGMLYTTEAWGIWGPEIEANPGKMFAPIEERFAAGKGFTGSDYVAAWRRVDALRDVWAERMAGFDAVLCPTAPILPPDVDRLMEEGDYYVTENLMALRNTRVGNLMGLCAVTLPTGVPSCGISLMGLPLQEDRLLRVCVAAEAALA